MIGDARTRQKLFHNGRRPARNVLIDVHGNDVKVYGRAGLEFPEHFKKHVTVFAPAHRDHHFVAFTDHVVVGNGLCGKTHDALFEFSHGNGGFDVAAGCCFNTLFIVFAAFGHFGRGGPGNGFFLNGVCHSVFPGRARRKISTPIPSQFS